MQTPYKTVNALLSGEFAMLPKAAANLILVITNATLKMWKLLGYLLWSLINYSKKSNRSIRRNAD